MARQISYNSLLVFTWGIWGGICGGVDKMLCVFQKLKAAFRCRDIIGKFDYVCCFQQSEEMTREIWCESLHGANLGLDLFQSHVGHGKAISPLKIQSCNVRQGKVETLDLSFLEQVAVFELGQLLKRSFVRRACRFESVFRSFFDKDPGYRPGSYNDQPGTNRESTQGAGIRLVQDS